MKHICRVSDGQTAKTDLAREQTIHDREDVLGAEQSLGLEGWLAPLCVRDHAHVHARVADLRAQSQRRRFRGAPR